MVNKNYILAGLAATVVNLIVNAGVHFLMLKDIMEKHPPVSEEFQRQLARPVDQLIPWAMAATSLTMGFFIVTVIKWSGARTFVAGLKNGFIVGFLFWSSINFGLYASSNYFSTVGLFADLPCSATAMATAAAVAAWVLGREKG